MLSRELSSNGADALLFELRIDPTADAKQIARSKGLLQENDQAALDAVIDSVLAEAASQQAVSDIKAGQQKALGYLVGQVMKRSGGKANPAVVSELITKRLQ
jgi:aspartyl-tRNA(Asn)/glutamyl-tRNA(Gln) amidotransferase subunit B